MRAASLCLFAGVTLAVTSGFASPRTSTFAPLFRAACPELSDPCSQHRRGAAARRIPSMESIVTESKYVEDLVDQEHDFDRWYVEVVQKAGLADDAPSAGAR